MCGIKFSKAYENLGPVIKKMFCQLKIIENQILGKNFFLKILSVHIKTVARVFKHFKIPYSWEMFLVLPDPELLERGIRIRLQIRLRIIKKK
jgi:hypothetical protein